MSGNKVGGAKAAQTNKKKYGSDFYAKIGKVGGTRSRGGGFTNNSELASRAGRLGGQMSRRGSWSPAQREAFEAKRSALLITEPTLKVPASRTIHTGVDYAVEGFTYSPKSHIPLLKRLFHRREV